MLPGVLFFPTLTFTSSLLYRFSIDWFSGFWRVMTRQVCVISTNTRPYFSSFSLTHKVPGWLLDWPTCLLLLLLLHCKYLELEADETGSSFSILAAPHTKTRYMNLDFNAIWIGSTSKQTSTVRLVCMQGCDLRWFLKRKKRRRKKIFLRMCCTPSLDAQTFSFHGMLWVTLEN